jgi:hypothetical protein
LFFVDLILILTDSRVQAPKNHFALLEDIEWIEVEAGHSSYLRRGTCVRRNNGVPQAVVSARSPHKPSFGLCGISNTDVKSERQAAFFFAVNADCSNSGEKPSGTMLQKAYG